MQALRRMCAHTAFGQQARSKVHNVSDFGDVEMDPSKTSCYDEICLLMQKKKKTTV
jgi:hypothetical protein